MAAELFVVGISYRTAVLDVREKLAFGEEALPAAVTELTALPALGEAMIVSTCNRVEIYAATQPTGEAAAAVDAVAGYLAAAHRLDLMALRPHLYERVERLGIESTVAVDRQDRDLEAELLEVLESAEGGVVLDGARQDAVALRFPRPGPPLVGQIRDPGAHGP